MNSKNKEVKITLKNKISITNYYKEIYNKIKILISDLSNIERNERIEKISKNLIESYSIDELFNFVSYFGMEIIPNEIKYSVGYKMDSSLFMIIRNINRHINKKEMNLKKKDELYGNTLLLIAASCWDPYTVIDLIKQGYDIYDLNNNGDSILHIICKGHFDDVADFLINELKKSSYDIYKSKSKLNIKYNKIIKLINLKNKDNKTCLVFKSNIYCDRLGEKFECLEKKLKYYLNSENLLIKRISVDLDIILPRNIYYKKRYHYYQIDFNIDFKELINIKIKSFLDKLKTNINKFKVFDNNNNSENYDTDHRGWILNKYDIRSQISRRDLEELSNFVTKSYKENKYKLYFLDKNNDKVYLKDSDNILKLLVNSNLINNDIRINKLFLEFDDNKFKNQDPIFGINKSTLESLNSKISNCNKNVINVYPIEVLKLHQKQLVDNYIKNKDKNNLIVFFIREFLNITYSDENIFDSINLKCKIDDLINLIDDLNNKVKSNHWIFEFNINKSENIYLNEIIIKKLKEYLISRKRKKCNDEFKSNIKDILNNFEKYKYYGLIAEFFNTWGCKFYFIKDYKISKFLFEISNSLIEIYLENLFATSLNYKYIYDNFKDYINDRKKLWYSKKEIFEENLKNSLKKCQ